jgi:hypothetical protein
MVRSTGDNEGIVPWKGESTTMNGKGGHDHKKHEHHGKHLNAAVATGSGTVNVTLDAGVAKDLYQALALALGPGGGKRKLSAAAAKPGGKSGLGSSKPGGGKGSGGGGRSKG